MHFFISSQNHFFIFIRLKKIVRFFRFKMRAIYFLFVFLSVSFDGAVCRKTKNPLILISSDGLRADRLDKFINENPDSYFASIAKSGVKAEFMK